MSALQRALGEARDQSLHALAAALALAPAVILGGWGIVLSAALVGLVRETAQHDTLEPWRLGRGSWLDIACWALGGALLSLLA